MHLRITSDTHGQLVRPSRFRINRVHRHVGVLWGFAVISTSCLVVAVGPAQLAHADDSPTVVATAKEAASQSGQQLTPAQAVANLTAVMTPADAAAVAAETSSPSSSTDAAVAAASYSGSKAATYADYWACDTNTGVTCRNGAYQSLGNDCTNFVSQALHAGGVPYTSGSRPWKPYDYAWAYAPGLGVWIEQHYPHSTWTLYRGSDLAQHYTVGLVGDLVFYDWGEGLGYSHVAMIVGWGTRGYYYTQYGAGDYMDQHTSDRYHAPWNYGYLINSSSIDRATMQVLVVHP